MVQVGSQNLHKDVKCFSFNTFSRVKFGEIVLWMIVTLITSQNWKTKH
jgi:hypothetical protein